jgi:hypothetical protein
MRQAALGATLEFLKKAKNAATIERLQERARVDGSPRGYVDLCHALVVQGNAGRALSVAQEGVRRFPRSLELADQLRLIWNQASSSERLELKRKAEATLSAGALRELAAHYLGVEELDLALETAEQIVEHHSTSSVGFCMAGRVLWKRFVRDHVASDGLRALEALRRAVALDPASGESFHLLAEACFYIGAVRSATEAAASAAALDPANKAVAWLRSILIPMAAETGAEADLVRAAEERDGPWQGYRPPESRERRQDSSAKAQVSRMLHGISLMAGVRCLALGREGCNLVAREGNVFEERRSPADPMVSLTGTFRGRIAAGTKHLGIGAFQEAEITLPHATVLAVGGMNAVLLVELERGAKTGAIVAGCRDVMGSLDRAPGVPENA